MPVHACTVGIATITIIKANDYRWMFSGDQLVEEKVEAPEVPRKKERKHTHKKKCELHVIKHGNVKTKHKRCSRFRPHLPWRTTSRALTGLVT